MTERPKTIEATLKLHHKAMQVIPEWMEEWGVRIPKAEMWNDPYCPQAKEVLCDLHTRLQAAFQEDEAVRADLLAACEAIGVDIRAAIADGASGTIVLPSRRGLKLLAAIAKAKGE